MQSVNASVSKGFGDDLAKYFQPIVVQILKAATFAVNGFRQVAKINSGASAEAGQNFTSAANLPGADRSPDCSAGLRGPFRNRNTPLPGLFPERNTASAKRLA